MTRELNSLLARLEDVVERMPDCFNTYEFAQKLALQHQREFLPRVTPGRTGGAPAAGAAREDCRGPGRQRQGDRRSAVALRDSLGRAGHLAALASQALSHPLDQQQQGPSRALLF